MPLPQCNFGCHSAHSDNFSHCSLSLSSAIGTVVFTASFFLSSSVAMQRAVCFASSLLGSSQHPNAAVASVVAAAASSSSAGTFRTADGTGGTAAAAAHNRQPSLWGKCVCVCDQAHPILLPNVHCYQQHCHFALLAEIECAEVQLPPCRRRRCCSLRCLCCCCFCCRLPSPLLSLFSPAVWLAGWLMLPLDAVSMMPPHTVGMIFSRQ